MNGCPLDTGVRASRIVNLCFHGIGEPARQLEHDEQQYWVTDAQFCELLDVIVRSHYSVRITFDDGNASDAAYALPALRERGLTAEFFIIAGRLGKPGSLGRDDTRGLVRDGMAVGSHGMHHRPWRNLNDDALRIELEDAPRMLEGILGRRVRTASLPFGSYDRRVLAAVRRSGIARAYTVDRAPAFNDAWLQARYTITRNDSPQSLERLLRRPRGSFVHAQLVGAKSLAKRWR